ncbi:MAG: DUF1365 domain-containing protein [Solirubrobacterales bacterium]|nr:DUF1365 domain-containing protein [Solirubrobacterales bacterium]
MTRASTPPTAPASCLYEGTIDHRRAAPATGFRHRIALQYVDLAELPTLLDGRLLARGPGLLRYRRGDYLGDPGVPLDAAVRDRVAQLGGVRPEGPIRLLTQLRSLGLCFNPVSFYYCFDRDERLCGVLAEVTNTPWGERHAYLLSDVDGASGAVRGSFAKQLHVSPFIGMDHRYEARATAPGDSLAVRIESRRGTQTTFEATLSMRRRALTPSAVARLGLRYPAAAARTLALIYGHAVGLRLAGARYFPHPGTATR